MVERIAQGCRHGASPGKKLFVRVRVAGAEAFVNSVGPHGAPFVVIALQPDLEEIIETTVRGDIRRREMRMVIQNGSPAA